MDEPGFCIRNMTEAELGLALEWAAADGWNPGLFDAHCFHAADPSGFFMGWLDGEPAGCISAVAYDEQYGFLGLYIVKPEYRGKGFGLKLWNAAMSHLGRRNVGLDGVKAQQENYSKSGFKLAFRNLRHQGKGGGAAPAGLIDLKAAHFEEIARYDRTVFPASRSNFLRLWTQQPRGVALALWEKGGLGGYGVLRACRHGFKIGPLFANDACIADALFRGLASRVPGEMIYLDTPEANAAAIRLAGKHGMEPVFETARMYTLGCPDEQISRCYGMTTLELG
jgi:GNAT superfamily N-acetyltransferase